MKNRRIFLIAIFLMIISLFAGCSNVKEITQELEDSKEELENIKQGVEALGETAENMENFEAPEAKVGVFDDDRLKAFAEEKDYQEYAQMYMNETYVGWAMDFSPKEIEYFENSDKMLEKYSNLFKDPVNTQFKEGGYLAITADLTGTYKDEHPAKITAFLSPESIVDSMFWSYSADIKDEYSKPTTNVGETKTLTAIYSLGDYSEDYVFIKGNGYANGGYPQYIMVFNINSNN